MPFSAISLPGVPFKVRLAFSFPVPPGRNRPPLRQRAASSVLAAAITCLIILGLLTLNGSIEERPHFKGGPVLLDLKPDAEQSDSSERKSQPKQKQQAAPPPKPSKAIPVPEVPPSPPMPTRSYYIHLTQEENEAADISRHPRVAMVNNGLQQQASAAGAGAGARDSQPIGTAPNGQPLYKAEWFRRPTHAELQTYLPPHMPARGIGVVACRTVANHHVDECVELGSSPPGSHLAGAVRQAAWQFLVRPPRLGGREMVGAWVSIEIDYSTKPAKETPETEAAEGSGE